MKKWILISVLILLLAGSGIAFYILSLPPKDSLSNGFKEEAVTRLLGRKAQLNPEVKTGNTQYKGKYISFKYPAKALIYAYRENSTSSTSASLEDFSFDIKQPKLVFNMTGVSKTSNSSTIEDYPAVRLRLQRSYEYTKSTFTMDKMRGVAFFKKENGGEKSGFILNDGKIYTISITGTSGREVEKLFSNIIATVSFGDAKP